MLAVQPVTSRHGRTFGLPGSNEMTNNTVPSEPAFFSAQITRARRFCLTLEPAPKDRLVVVSGGREHCTPEYEIHRTDFPLYCIEFVAQGQGTVKLRRREYPLVAGTVFAYGPGVPHDILPEPTETTIKYFVDFAGRDARRLLRQAGLPPGRALRTRAPNDVLALFDDLIRNGLRKTPFTKDIAALILRHLILKIAETAAAPGPADLQAFATYTRCKQHIEDRWTEIATVQDAARHCAVDVAYLCRLFKRFDHQSPYQFLLALRMNEAADQLCKPHASIKQVSDLLGFADQFHFSRVFKRVYGVSPRRFAHSVRRA
jgi:AraC-like DNA-binding protein